MSVYVVGHKPFTEIAPGGGYHTLRVGQANPSWNPEFCDDTGENISSKNPYYCELTGLYWIWKNAPKEEYLGLVHYRRYFVADSLFAKNVADDILREEKIREILKNHDIIVPELGWKSVKSGVLYRNLQREEQDVSLSVLEDIIKEKYPQDLDSYRNVAYGYKIYHGNMFIAKDDIFRGCAQWLFDLFSELEKRMIAVGDPITPRFFGYVSEYMIAVYAHSRIARDRIAHCSVAMITDTSSTSKVPYGLKKAVKKTAVYQVFNERKKRKQYVSKRIAYGKKVEDDVLTRKVFRI